jgi:hypothetical protein
MNDKEKQIEELKKQIEDSKKVLRDKEEEFDKLLDLLDDDSETDEDE